MKWRSQGTSHLPKWRISKPFISSSTLCLFLFCSFFSLFFLQFLSPFFIWLSSVGLFILYTSSQPLFISLIFHSVIFNSVICQFRNSPSFIESPRSSRLHRNGGRSTSRKRNHISPNAVFSKPQKVWEYGPLTAVLSHKSAIILPRITIEI